jgi:hypothetical protein
VRRKLLLPRLEEIRTAGIGHAGTVRSLYVGAELFVEYLVGQRGMGGVQSLLKAMGSTRDRDAAFREVYARNYDGMRRAWLDDLRRKWGVGDARR